MSSFTRLSFLGQVSVGGAFRGLIEQWQGNPYRWRTLAVSIALTAIVLYLFIPPNVKAPPKPYEVVYISTLEEGRTDEEIIASNIENQKRKDKWEAELREREQVTIDAYETLGRATFLDMDRLKREADKIRTEREREQEQRRAEAQAKADAIMKERAKAVGDQ